MDSHFATALVNAQELPSRATEYMLASGIRNGALRRGSKKSSISRTLNIKKKERGPGSFWI
jgi:hypothetical protein